MNNLDIREAIKKTGLKQYEVAEKYGIHEASFSRRLRHELGNSEKKKIFKIIDDLDKRQKEDA